MTAWLPYFVAHDGWFTGAGRFNTRRGYLNGLPHPPCTAAKGTRGVSFVFCMRLRSENSAQCACCTWSFAQRGVTLPQPLRARLPEDAISALRCLRLIHSLVAFVRATRYPACARALSR